MNVLIDNKDLQSVYGITVLDYTGALNFAAIREDERVWEDKSGVDPNIENVRYDVKEFVLQCIVKADNEAQAYNLVDVLISYLFEKGAFILSLRDSIQGIRECFICERSDTLIAKINIRQQNSLYTFNLGLKDINPNAISYKTEIIGNSVTINYEKGQNAILYWGNGDRIEVSNSGDYIKVDYPTDDFVDVIIDLDKNAEIIVPLVAEFSANETVGTFPFTVQFTDASTGSPIIWSWDFGDGSTSAEQNPEHTYEGIGSYTVTLQIFNISNGSDIEQKIDYIFIRKSRRIINDSGDFHLINDDPDYTLIN